MRRLVLYEPWIERHPDGLIEEPEGLAASGTETGRDDDLSSALGMTDTELERGWRPASPSVW